MVLEILLVNYVYA